MQVCVVMLVHMDIVLRQLAGHPKVFTLLTVFHRGLYEGMDFGLTNRFTNFTFFRFGYGAFLGMFSS